MKIFTMNNGKQFGVWMDNHQATVVGAEGSNNDTFSVIAHIKGEAAAPNSSENTANNHQKTLQQKFYKEIASNLTNATVIHVTGTGQAQEQFIKFLSETPQFKNSKTSESTSKMMSDEKLLEFLSSKLN